MCEAQARQSKAESAAGVLDQTSRNKLEILWNDRGNPSIQMSGRTSVRDLREKDDVFSAFRVP